MADPFVAEIRMFGFNFAPKGWALCNGQLLSISQNTALFSLLGTTYGGDGKSTFALPDLQARVAMALDNLAGAHFLGESSGEAAHTLIASEQPDHTHPVFGQNGPRNVTNPSGAAIASGDIFGVGPPNATFAAGAVQPSSVAQPHENRQPYLVVNFCIALQGVFPPRS
jgi:microcystin-dependent protein